MGEIRVKSADGWLNLPSHEKTADGWKDIPTHTMTANGWQGELTSQSPLEFRATGQSLLDWRVDGKTSGNLFDKDNTEGIEDNQYISQNTGDKISDSLYYISAPIAVTSGETYYWIFRLTSGGNPHSAPTVGFYDANDNQIGVASHNSRVLSFPFTPPVNCAYIRASVYKTDINEAMLVKSSTAPTSYEPYGGVGVRTENLFDTNVSPVNFAMGEPDEQNRAQVVQVSGYGMFIFPVDNSSVKSYTVKIYSASQVGVLRMAFVDSIPLANYQYSYDVVQIKNTTSPSATTTNNGLRPYMIVQISVAYLNEYGTSRIMLNEGNAAQALVPYGYKIPVTVNGATTNLYTDHQLMDGDSLDYTTDQTSIPITQGDNTLTVETAVQPDKVFVKFEG